MAMRNYQQSQHTTYIFKRNAVRRAFAVETLESRQLLSAAPMAGFQPATDFPASTFETVSQHVGFVVDKIVVDPAPAIDLQFSGRIGITIPIQAIKVPPASEAVDILIPDWMILPDVVYTGGKDPLNLPPSDSQSGNDLELPEYEFPDPYVPELQHPETESTELYNEPDGGFTPSPPPSSLENTRGDFGSYNGGTDVTATDREAVEVLEMLASLQYVLGERRESSDVTAHLPLAEPTSATDETEPAANDRSAQPQPSDGGMVELSPSALAQICETKPGEPTIDIEQLLALPPQLDTARGNYQAFEIFTDESDPVHLESILDTSFVPSPLGPEVPNGTVEQPDREVTELESEILSGLTVDTSASSAVVLESPSGFTGIRTLNTAGAIAIVVLASRAARVRHEERVATPPNCARLTASNNLLH
jgi:hypothetical protein